MDPDYHIPDCDPRALQSIIKMGGKKKLDSVIEMVKASGPQRVKELLAATDLLEAQAAARALKASAAKLGLGALEDACDHVVNAKDWTQGKALAMDVQARLQRALPALEAMRKTL